MTKDQASKEWLRLDTMLRELRRLKIGVTAALARHYALCIQEMEKAQDKLKKTIEPD